jgi:hypothetical protein
MPTSTFTTQSGTRATDATLLAFGFTSAAAGVLVAPGNSVVMLTSIGQF